MESNVPLKIYFGLHLAKYVESPETPPFIVHLDTATNEKRKEKKLLCSLNMTAKVSIRGTHMPLPRGKKYICIKKEKRKPLQEDPPPRACPPPPLMRFPPLAPSFVASDPSSRDRLLPWGMNWRAWTLRPPRLAAGLAGFGVWF